MDEVTRCYEVLGLTTGSSEAQIKQAYRDLVKVWHPDRFSHDERLRLMAQDKLKEINGAYEFLIQRLSQEPVTPESETGFEAASEEAAAPHPAEGDSSAGRKRFVLWTA